MTCKYGYQLAQTHPACFSIVYFFSFFFLKSYLEKRKKVLKNRILKKKMWKGLYMHFILFYFIFSLKEKIKALILRDREQSYKYLATQF